MDINRLNSVYQTILQTPEAQWASDAEMIQWYNEKFRESIIRIIWYSNKWFPDQVSSQISSSQWKISNNTTPLFELSEAQGILKTTIVDLQRAMEISIDDYPTYTQAINRLTTVLTIINWTIEARQPRIFKILIESMESALLALDEPERL